MKHVRDLLPADWRERLTAAEDRHLAAILAGHERYGWSLTAMCSACGDRGVRPDGELCGCHHGEAARLARERKLARLRHWHESSRTPKRFQHWSMDSHPNRDAAAAVAVWLADPRSGRNLYLVGPVGVGKTGLAIAASRALVERGEYPVQFWSTPDLLDHWRPGADDGVAVMRTCQRAVWLTLDDVGVERPTDWARERLHVLINARYEAERGTILTSNCDLGALAGAWGERMVSRLAETMTVVRMDGPDWRGVRGEDRGCA